LIPRSVNPSIQLICRSSSVLEKSMRGCDASRYPFYFKSNAFYASTLVFAVPLQLLHLDLMAVEHPLAGFQQLFLNCFEEGDDNLARRSWCLIAHTKTSVDEGRREGDILRTARTQPSLTSA
jgi:hypothetical protein